MTKRQAHLRGALTALALAAGIGSSGCGAAAAPQQLVDARASYAAAASGPAARLTPAELVDAKQALVEAERRFEQDGASEETLHASYLAQRRAEIAGARGGVAEAEAVEARGRLEFAAVRETRLTAAEAALLATQAQVGRSDRKLAATGAELRATDQALTEERKGRAEAERRTSDAMRRLALAASVAVREEPRGTVITLPSNVLFATARYELLPGAKSQLDSVADALKEQPNVSILVEGHTDSQGTNADNLVLGKRRAESVRAHLASKGVPAAQLAAAGIGEERPVGDNKTNDGRAQNRRVEIIVTPREPR